MKVLQTKLTPIALAITMLSASPVFTYANAATTDITGNQTSTVPWTQTATGEGINVHDANSNVTAGNNFDFGSSTEADINISNTTLNNTGAGYGLTFTYGGSTDNANIAIDNTTADTASRALYIGHATDSVVNIKDSTFTSGDAIATSFNGSNSVYNIDGSTITNTDINNTGVYIDGDSSTLNLSNSVVNGGITVSGNGLITNLAGTQVDAGTGTAITSGGANQIISLKDSTLKGGMGINIGWGADDDQLFIDNSVITATAGDAVLLSGGNSTINITDSTLTAAAGNAITVSDGAGSTIDITNSTINGGMKFDGVDNSSLDIKNSNIQPLEINGSNSTTNISDSRFTGNGSGVTLYGTNNTVNLNNIDISGMTDEGGYFILAENDDSTINVTNSILNSNSPDSAFIETAFNSGSVINVENTIYTGGTQFYRSEYTQGEVNIDSSSITLAEAPTGDTVAAFYIMDGQPDGSAMNINISNSDVEAKDGYVALFENGDAATPSSVMMTATNSNLVGAIDLQPQQSDVADPSLTLNQSHWDLASPYDSAVTQLALSGSQVDIGNNSLKVGTFSSDGSLINIGGSGPDKVGAFDIATDTTMTGSEVNINVNGAMNTQGLGLTGTQINTSGGTLNTGTSALTLNASGLAVTDGGTGTTGAISAKNGSNISVLDLGSLTANGDVSLDNSLLNLSNGSSVFTQGFNATGSQVNVSTNSSLNAQSIVLDNSTLTLNKSMASAASMSGTNNSNIAMTTDSHLNAGNATGSFNVYVASSGTGGNYNGLSLIDTAAGSTATFNGSGYELGTYRYQLVQDGNEWELQSGGQLSNSASAAASMQSAPLLSWNQEMDTVHQRMTASRRDGDSGGVWGAYFGGSSSTTSSDGAHADQNVNGFSIGVDNRLKVGNGSFLVGAAVSHGVTDSDNMAGGSYGNSNDTTVQGYISRTYNNGAFVDGIASYSTIDNDLTAVANDGTRGEGSFDTHSVGASLKGGFHFDLQQNMFIEPYARLSAMSVDGADYTLSNGMSVSNGTYKSLQGEAGADFGATFDLPHNQTIRPYVKLAYQAEFEDGNSLDINNVDIDNNLNGSGVKVGGGIEYQLIKNLGAYAAVNYLGKDGGDKGTEQKWNTNVGIRYTW
ncbi:autotransporter outer membrane beta-barrel domain-containing protein (plasmid) [Hafnia alvei]|uniref:autotransporter outer membrane beta-barrel domain-containing protein n=1 Tax=Hafnia alvei TaxID=569 RepID=UPI000C9F8517|nr:autotransporter outer membrane beta-barrel domain-containing protein [Hafnia alvei]MBI0278625.1 autotransporter outer membrane beta-barrel domain-containing protein [Hafnia alvei]PNL03918.1 hypothetical protein CEQ28_000550 [Hafnia alvei]